MVLLALFFFYIMWSEIQNFLAEDEPCPEGQERLQVGAPCQDIEVAPTIVEKAKETFNTVQEGLSKAVEQGPTKHQLADKAKSQAISEIKKQSAPSGALARGACWVTSWLHQGRCGV